MKKFLPLLLLLAIPVLAQNHAHMLSGVNAQTGTTYTLVPADVTKVVTLNNAAAVAVTIPAASTDGFGAGTIFAIKNLGIGNVMVTPESGTIDGQASVLLTTGASVELRSDGSNYVSLSGGSSSSSGSACSVNIVCKGTGAGLPVVDSSVFDDSLNPVRATHGYNAAAGGISFEMANSATGTTINRLVCNDGTNHAIICPDNATSGILGTALTGAGTTGNVTVCSLINCPNIFDNQSVVNDFAIAGTAGRLHDTSSTSATSNNTNFLVLTANSGVNTSAQVRPPGDLSGGPAGMTNPMTTLGDIIYGGASGTPTRRAGATTLNGVPQSLVSTAAAGVATAPTYAPAGVVPRIVSGTTDTILFTDRNKFIQYTNASAIAVTVPQAGTTGFANNFYFCAENRGAGLVTFTPTTSTVNGAATYKLNQNASGCFVSDNANYITKDQAISTLTTGPDISLFTTPIAGATPRNAFFSLNDTANYTDGLGIYAQNATNTNGFTSALQVISSVTGTQGTSAAEFAVTTEGSSNVAGGIFGMTSYPAHHSSGTLDALYYYYGGDPDHAGGGAITNAYGIWFADFSGWGATNPYYSWFDSRGVRRVKEDNTFDAVGQAIEALYNPQFTKYTPGAVDFERVVLGQWSGNVAQIGTEKGGTGTLRKVQIIGAGFTVPDLEVNSKLVISATAPTVSSGFGTSPTISANNGTASFRVNVGTGGSATAGVIGLPTATTGWNCFVNDITAAAGHVAYNTRQTASSTTSATLENQTTSSGAAVAWAASDILAVSCFAY